MKIKRSFIFVYIYLILMLSVPTNYYIIAPNESKTIKEAFEIEGYEQSPYLSSISVISLDYITPFMRLVYRLDPNMDVDYQSPYEQQINVFEQIIRSKNQKNASIEQAIIWSYKLAKEKVNSIQIDYEFVGMIVDYRETFFDNLLIGDIIIDVNHQGFSDYESMGLYFLSLEDEVILTISRNQEIFDIKIHKTKEHLFRFYPKYEIHSTYPSIKLNDILWSTGGPSAGMMYTLSIYLGLTSYDLIDELVIGTGTIRYNGEIGLIGGIRQKVYQAYKEGAKYFILPKAQLNEVLDFESKINLYPVETIEDAIEVIYDIFGQPI